MKKSLIAIAIFLLMIASLPIIGNSYIQNLIDDKVIVLNSQGLKIENLKTTTNYLSTKKHFEFIVEDSKKLAKYFGDKEYSLENFVDGSKFTVDIKYSNLLFSKVLNIDISLKSLSSKVSTSLKDKDKVFYKDIIKFLKDGNFLYHISYNFIDNRYKTSLKDIDNDFNLKNGATLKLRAIGIKSKGLKDISKPNIVNIKEFFVLVVDGDLDFKFLVENMKIDNQYISIFDYENNLKIKNFMLDIKDYDYKLNISFQNSKFNTKVMKKDKYISVLSDIKLDNFKTDIDNSTISLKKFDEKIEIKQIDIEKSKKILNYLSTLETTRGMLTKVKSQQYFIELLSEGLELNINKFLLKDLVIDKKDFNNFELKSKIIFKKDSNLKAKLNISYMLMLSDLELDTHLKFSNEIYKHLTKQLPKADALEKLLKRVGNDVLFDIKYKDTKLVINSKELN